MPTNPPRVSVTIVRAPACHFCEDAEQAVRSLAERHPIDLRLIEMTSPKGLALVAAYRPAMNPLVLVDDAFFSSGPLPRHKLTALLERVAVQPRPVPDPVG